MANPLLLVFTRLLAADPDRPAPIGELTPEVRSLAADEALGHSAGVFLVLRRIRVPLIALIFIFAISILGLTLIPGRDAEGHAVRMTLFDAFYFMSYTATTIGFGETPTAFTTAQRMWVSFIVFLSVIGWAYGIGTLLSLTQDRSFRRALTRQHMARKVRHLTEPFHILVGYGNPGKAIARALDDLGRRFVVIDASEARISSVDLDVYHADTPALLGNARDTRALVLAGLAHPNCEGILALTDDDRTNLDVTMTSAMLRPGLPVTAVTTSREIADRMALFDAWHVVNPVDRFGDHLRILLRAPAAYQLMAWLTAAPGAPLPRRRARLPHGRWVVCGTGAFADEIVDDLRAEGLDVSVLDRIDASSAAGPLAGAGPGTGPGAVAGAGPDPTTELLRGAVGFVAAGPDDTANLWLLDAARRANPDLFTVTRQEQAANRPLFDALGVDFAKTSSEIIGREIMARLAHPALMQLLPQVPRLGHDWSRAMIERIARSCGPQTPQLWRIDLSAEAAPALQPWLDADGVRLGDLLRSPADRTQPLDAVPLMLLRDGRAEAGPADDTVLRPGDALLLAARTAARQGLDATLTHDPSAAYVLEDRFVPTSWLWRRLSRTERGDPGSLGGHGPTGAS